MAENPALLVELDALIARAKDRLSRNADYIMLRALERARAEAVAGQLEAAKSDGDAAHAANITRLFPAKKATAPNQLEAAAAVLEAEGQPLPIDEMVLRVKAMGGVVGGKNPNINLGSTLSRSEEFASIRWKGQKMWWFTDRPLPEKISLLGAAE
jgi:hypothetical protein